MERYIIYSRHVIILLSFSIVTPEKLIKGKKNIVWGKTDRVKIVYEVFTIETEFMNKLYISSGSKWCVTVFDAGFITLNALRFRHSILELPTLFKEFFRKKRLWLLSLENLLVFSHSSVMQKNETNKNFDNNFVVHFYIQFQCLSSKQGEFLVQKS